MASFSKRISDKGVLSWRVAVRIKGIPDANKTFPTLEEAKEWAAHYEESFKNPYTLRPTFDMAVDRYLQEILPTKSAGMQQDEKAHLLFWTDFLKGKYLDDIFPTEIENAANTLYKKISRTTKLPLTAESRRKYIMTLSFLYNTAGKKWGWVKFNPVSLVNKHVPSKKKDKNSIEINITCPIRKVFLDEIQREMKKRNLSNGGLAYLMGVNKSTVQSIFNPKVNITINMMVRVCKALGKEVEIRFKD